MVYTDISKWEKIFLLEVWLLLDQAEQPKDIPTQCPADVVHSTIAMNAQIQLVRPWSFPLFVGSWRYLAFLKAASLGGSSWKKARSKRNLPFLYVCERGKREILDYVWQVLDLDCAFWWQFYRGTRQFGGWTRGELLVPSAGGFGNLWTVGNSERTWGSLGPATDFYCFYIHFFFFFGPFEFAFITSVHLKALTPFHRRKLTGVCLWETWLSW